MILLHGDCKKKLKDLEKDSIQCCITSPPYWHLKDYETDGQLGKEETPEEYAENLSQVFEEVRRVLKPDGTLFLNLGDTFCGGGGYCPNAPSNKAGSMQSKRKGTKCGPRPVPRGYKAKDLVGFPWMMAFALRKNGWYLRSDIIWNKPNCMPENVTDRPTRNHEYIFLLSKSKKYFYNAEAVAEPTKEGTTRNRRSVWDISPARNKTIHTAVFPEKLVEICLLAGSSPGDVVLDPFMGSGTVGKIAVERQRDFVGIDINPAYVEISRQRIMDVGNKLV